MVDRQQPQQTQEGEERRGGREEATVEKKAGWARIRALGNFLSTHWVSILALIFSIASLVPNYTKRSEQPASATNTTAADPTHYYTVAPTIIHTTYHTTLSLASTVYITVTVTDTYPGEALATADTIATVTTQRPVMHVSVVAAPRASNCVHGWM